MDASQGDLLKKWSEIVTKTWDDDAFKKRLLADPVAVLKENGFPIPRGGVKVVEGSEIYLPLPPKPSATQQGHGQSPPTRCCENVASAY